MKLRRRPARGEVVMPPLSPLEAGTLPSDDLRRRVAELEVENRRLHAALATAGPLTAALEDVIAALDEHIAVAVLFTDERLQAVAIEAVRQSRLRVR